MPSRAVEITVAAAFTARSASPPIPDRGTSREPSGPAAEQLEARPLTAAGRYPLRMPGRQGEPCRVGFELIDTTFQALLPRSIGLIFGVGPLRHNGRSTHGCEVRLPAIQLTE